MTPLIGVLAELAKQTNGRFFPHTSRIIVDAEMLASMLDVDAGTVRNWSSEHNAPGWQVGRTMFYDVDEFLACMPRTDADGKKKASGANLRSTERRT